MPPILLKVMEPLPLQECTEGKQWINQQVYNSNYISLFSGVNRQSTAVESLQGSKSVTVSTWQRMYMHKLN